MLHLIKIIALSNNRFDQLSKILSKFKKDINAASIKKESAQKDFFYHRLSAITNKINEQFENQLVLGNDLNLDTLKEVANLYVAELPKALQNQTSYATFYNKVQELLEVNSSAKSRSGSNDSNQTQYEPRSVLIESEIPQGKVFIELNESHSGVRTEGLGFTFKFIRNQDHAQIETKWIQFIARSILINGEYQEGTNTFGSSTYPLSRDNNSLQWSLDKARRGETPFYSESQTHLPESEGNIPTFDQPNGWSSKFKFNNFPNIFKTLKEHIDTGGTIHSKAYFTAYLVHCNTHHHQVLAKATFQIHWDLTKEHFDDDKQRIKIDFANKEQNIETQITDLLARTHFSIHQQNTLDPERAILIQSQYSDFFNH